MRLTALHDAGDRVVVIAASARPLESEPGCQLRCRFAQVWTHRDGRAARMDMYSDPAEALEAAGLSE